MKRIVDAEHLELAKITGMQELATVVGKTLGPAGLPVMIERTGEALNGDPLPPRITKDGVSVAEECSSKDPEIDIVIQTVKDICRKTNREAGDGTTTAIILGNAILKEATACLGQNGHLPQNVKRELDATGIEVLSLLKASSWPVTEFDQVREVANISANGDEEVGRIIAEAFAAVGAEGVVTVDEGTSEGLELTRVEGYRFDRGAQAQDVFFNNTSLSAFEADNAAVIVFDGAVRAYTELVPLLQLLAEVDEHGHSRNPPPPIVIIATEFSRDAIQWMLIQKSERGVQFCPVVGPNVTHVRSGYLQDLAVFTNGQCLGNGGKNLQNIESSHIGRVGRVVIDKYTTTLYDGAGAEDEIIRRVDLLKVRQETAESPFDKQITQDRIAALTGGVAKILIGGRTELEIKERYDRVEDALNAARAALREGVVVGGGVALLRVALRLSELSKSEGATSVGRQILIAALAAPFEQILCNAGFSDKTREGFYEQIRTSGNQRTIDASGPGVCVNAIDAGIIDPLFVTRTAFKNALSISGLLLTAAGALVIDK